MRKEKVKINFSQLRDRELATLGGRVVRAMLDPQTAFFYSDLRSQVITLAACVEDYTQKHQIASQGGSTLEVSLKNESRTKVLTALRTLASYVNEKARGQLSWLLATGLYLTKPYGRKEIPAATSRVELGDGDLSGQVKISFNRIKNAWMYEIEWAEEQEAQTDIKWEGKQQTTRSKGTILSPFTPGVRYCFRVRAINEKGAGEWSDTVCFMAR